MSEQELQLNRQAGEKLQNMPTYEEKQQASWETLEKYKQTSKVNTAMGVRYSEYDSMNLFELRDALFNDGDSKTRSFRTMYNAVNDLLNLAAGRGVYFDQNGNGMTKDFFESLFTASSSVNMYLATHKGFRWSDKGDRRVQIATRMANLLRGLQEEVKRVQSSLPEKKARMIDYAKEGLSEEEIEEREKLRTIDKNAADVLRFAESGNLNGDKDTNKKAAKEWIIGGYTDELERLIEGTGVIDETRESQNNFLAFITDQNNRLLANRMAISVLTENDRRSTLDIPWMREELKDYLSKNISEEQMLIKTTEFVDIVKQQIQQFGELNRERIITLEKRRNRISRALNVHLKSKDFYDYPIVKDMLTDPEEASFDQKLKSMKETVAQNDALIGEYLNKRFSDATRDYVASDMMDFIGAFRVFASTDEIMDQLDVFCDMVKYTAPAEFIVERSISNKMKNIKLDSVRRDHFVRTITGGDAKKLALIPIELFDKEADKYADNVKANSKSFAKRVDKKGLYLTKNQWDEIEQLDLESGAMENSQFKVKLESIMARQENDTRVSRNEYLTGRRFSDARKEPARILRAQKEMKKINQLDAVMKDKFLICLLGDGSDEYADYRKLDAAYKGTEEQLEAERSNEESLFKERTVYLNRALQRGGVAKELWPAYAAKFRSMLGGIRNISSDMTDDEKLYAQRINLEQFGVRTFDDAMDRITAEGEKLAKVRLKDDGTIGEISGYSEVKDKYEEGKEILRTYDGGKYAEIADILVGIPMVFAEIMGSSKDELIKFLGETVDDKLRSFMEGTELAGKKRKVPDENKNRDNYVIPAAVRKQYAFSYIRSIYEGTLKGNAGFFRNQLLGYNEKVFNIKPDGSRSIADNIKNAEKTLDKELLKLGKKGAEALNLKMAVLSRIYDMSNDTSEFLKLMDSDELKKYAKQELTSVISSVKELEVTGEFKNSITKEFTDSLPETDENLDKKKENIRNRVAGGRSDRVAFLRVDKDVMSAIRVEKSLVRSGELGRRRIKLGTSKADDMRGRIKKYCSSFDLPKILTDALVEEGMSEAFTERAKSVMWSNSKLISHAFAMEKLNSLLTKGFKDDAPMSDEEAQMYIISLYGNLDKRELFEKDGGPDVASLRQSEDYKNFRENFKKLTQLENMVTEDETLERERVEMAKNLRIIMTTGLGTLDSNGEPFNNDLLITDREKSAHLLTIGSIIDRNRDYVEYSARLSVLIKSQLDREESDKNVKYSAHFRDMKTRAIREYFMTDLLRNIKSGKKFDEGIWSVKLQRAYEDKDIWENILFDRNSISSDAFKQAESRKLHNNASEESIAAAIRDNTVFFKGKVNKYERLDEDQKKIFALGLMLMDKGAIGYGTSGSIDLINARSIKSEKLEKIREELDKYVTGQPFNPEIDYMDAFNKLVNYGETGVLYKEGYTLSTTAYNKALHFTKVITSKRIALMEKDNERLNNGYESINTAFVKYGRQDQMHEVDSMRDETLTLEDVRGKILEYVKRDTLSLKDIGKDVAKNAYKSPLGVSALDKDAMHNIRMNRIASRFAGMSMADIKLFVRIIQDRGVADYSRAGTGAFVEQAKREALIESLSADARTRSSVLAGFDDDESCHRALINVLSFQLRDDIDFRNKDLTRDHFVGGALKRRTFADWELVERVFGMIDEIKERRASIYALSHASDFIAESGNIHAIREATKLMHSYANKEDFRQEHFEKYIKQQAKIDGGSDIKRAVTGYHQLSDKEKALFFKVLTRRDLLDISKKDLTRNYFGIKERNYVNQAERDQLIDKYIQSNLEGNVGIINDGSVHYDALNTLFSTQLSDREKFDSDKDLESMTAAERYIFMGRTTAIDWKLFKRALNFVNRASEELEYVEGNRQLYRGAGDIISGGSINISYSFLRKNFHRTGNQWTRKLGRVFARNAKETIKFDVLSNIADVVGGTSAATKYLLRTDKQGLMRCGLRWVKNKVAQNKDLEKGMQEYRDVDFKVENIGIKDYVPTEEDKAKEKARRDNLTDYQHIQEGIDNIFAQGKTVAQNLEEVRVLLRDHFASPAAEHFGILKPLTSNESVAAKTDSDNIVEKFVKESKTGEDKSYGDGRDKLVEVKEQAQNAQNAWKTIDNMPLLKNVTKLVKYTTQKAVYGFINDTLINAKIETGLPESASQKDKDEAYMKALTKEIDKYASDVFMNLLSSAIGEENAGQLLSLEESYYALKQPIADTLKTVVNGINYAKKCVLYVEGVTTGIQNIRNLNFSQKAGSQRRAEDDEKLRKAGESRLSDTQALMASRIVDKHRGMADLGNEIATAVQEFNIAGETINLAISTATLAGGKLNIGQEIIAKVIKEGLQFALFALRIASDRNSLADYFLHTEAGKQMIEKTRSGFAKANDTELSKELDEAIDRQKTLGVSSLVDIISDSRGYEHTSELVENTAMSMAQSIVFCASNYNPMAETRLMAITVMSVMGLDAEIGSTDPSTVEKLFKKFNVSR